MEIQRYFVFAYCFSYKYFNIFFCYGIIYTHWNMHRFIFLFTFVYFLIYSSEEWTQRQQSKHVCVNENRISNITCLRLIKYSILFLHSCSEYSDALQHSLSISVYNQYKHKCVYRWYDKKNKKKVIFNKNHIDVVFVCICFVYYILKYCYKNASKQTTYALFCKRNRKWYWWCDRQETETKYYNKWLFSAFSQTSSVALIIRRHFTAFFLQSFYVWFFLVSMAFRKKRNLLFIITFQRHSHHFYIFFE